VKHYVIGHRTELLAALKMGYSVRHIWQTLLQETQIKCTYQGFLGVIKTHLPLSEEVKPPGGKTPLITSPSKDSPKVQAMKELMEARAAQRRGSTPAKIASSRAGQKDST
jgi:hypothetical protein